MNTPRKPKELALDYATSKVKPATRRAYKEAFEKFIKWAHDDTDARQTARRWPRQAFCGADVADYIAHLAATGYSFNTIQKQVSAVNYCHKVEGLESPTRSNFVSDTLKGIKNRLPREVNQKRPLLQHHLDAMVNALPGVSKYPIRDKALLLLGWHLAARRSEICELERKNITITPKGLIVVFEDTKTGALQKAINRTDGPLCPVAAVETYLDGLTWRPFRLFPSPYENEHGLRPINASSYVNLIKELCEAIGLDATLYAGHSMRSGFVTQAAENQTSIMETQAKTGHRSLVTTARYYQGFKY